MSTSSMSTSSNMSTSTFAHSDVEYDSDTSYGSSLDYSAAFDSTTDDFESTTTTTITTSHHSNRSTSTISASSTISATSTLLSTTPHIAFAIPQRPKSSTNRPRTLAGLTRDREEQLYREKEFRRAARAHKFTRHLHTALHILDPSLAALVCPSVERATVKADLATRESHLAALKAEDLKFQIKTLRSQKNSKSTHASAHQPDFQTKRAACVRNEAVPAMGVGNARSNSSSSSNTRVFSIPSLRRQFSSSTSSSSSSSSTTKKQRAQAAKKDEKEKERQLRTKQYDYIYGINPSFADGFPA